MKMYLFGAAFVAFVSSGTVNAISVGTNTADSDGIKTCLQSCNLWKPVQSEVVRKPQENAIQIWRSNRKD